jgi:hypothetical protein
LICHIQSQFILFHLLFRWTSTQNPWLRSLSSGIQSVLTLSCTYRRTDFLLQRFNSFCQSLIVKLKIIQLLCSLLIWKSAGKQTSLRTFRSSWSFSLTLPCKSCIICFS